MRKGEKGIVAAIIASVVILAVYRMYDGSKHEGEDPGIPFYTTATPELSQKAGDLIRKEKCRDCHSLWAIRDLTIAVPAPALDGMGRFRTEEWLYQYFSAENPQAMQPSRLKDVYKMPSFAHLSEEERRTLAKYLASLQVKDWYFEQAKKRRDEKLTGITLDSSNAE
ncbi:MAG: cytochrome c [Gammaproteobacteria bacterium]|nr:cytochrome c [Gammaproteobacteria bacterium]